MFGKSLEYLRNNSLNIISIGKAIDEGPSVVNRFGLFIFQVEMRPTYQGSDYYQNKMYMALRSKHAYNKCKRELIFNIIDFEDQDD